MIMMSHRSAAYLGQKRNMYVVWWETWRKEAMWKMTV